MKHADIPEPDLRALLQRVARRDRKAFETLVRFYNGRLSRFAACKLNDPHDLNEVVNDTFLSIWKNPQGYQYQSAFFTYLVSIVKRKVTDVYRRQGRILENREPESEATEDRHSIENLPDDSADPTSWLEQAQSWERFDQCKQKLPPLQREIIYWLFEMEATEAEAAQACECPAGTVKSRFAAARNALKRCLMGWYREVRHA